MFVNIANFSSSSVLYFQWYVFYMILTKKTFLILGFLSYGKALLCYCDICVKTNNTCQTDGVCAAWVSYQSDDFKTGFR